MHGSGGDWSTPKRSSKSKKKLRHCWVSHWRRQTATTSHDGCRCCPGADTRSDRQGLRGSEPCHAPASTANAPVWPGRWPCVVPDRAHETRHDLVCRLLLEKKKKKSNGQMCRTT